MLNKRILFISTNAILVSNLITIKSYCYSDDERKENLKPMLAKKAIDDYVKSNSIIGIGTGTTVSLTIDYLSFKMNTGDLKQIQVIPCSDEIQKVLFIILLSLFILT